MKTSVLESLLIKLCRPATYFCEICEIFKNTNGVVLVSLLSTLNIFHTLFYVSNASWGTLNCQIGAQVIIDKTGYNSCVGVCFRVTLSRALR